jgi:RNA polymerase sigma-70 factor (ECF subfamily)
MPPTGDTGSAGALASSLLVRLKGGDAKAWDGLLQLYGPLVYSWCRTRWDLSPEDAADILQDVMKCVLQSLGNYRGGNFVSWLGSITRSRVIDRLRDGGPRAAGGSGALQRLGELTDPRPGPGEGDTAAEPPVGYGDLGGVLQRAVERVRAKTIPATWEAFWQVTVNGRAPEDVARDLGLTRNAVYIANSRVLRRLRDELGTPAEPTNDAS